jgi:PAS domain S-box-containing protein
MRNRIRLFFKRSADGARRSGLLAVERRAHAHTEESRVRITRILESITDAFFALDRQWRFTYVNGQASRMLQNLRRTDLFEPIGKTIWDVAPELVGTRFEAEYRCAVDKQKATHFEEYFPGVHAWLEVHAYPSEDGLSVYFRDVTERKRWEETLRSLADERAELLARQKKALADAEESNRLKDEFLAMVSHELRTPLTAIVGWVQLARAGKLDGDQLSRALEIIDRNAALQSRLVADMLETSRMITGKIEIDFHVLDPAPIVQAALDSIRPTTTAKGVSLEASVQQVPAIYGNDARLQQILWNLLTNAVKFTPKGGTVRVSLARTGTDIMIQVADTGSGIKREFLPCIFERFRQADSSSTRQHGGLGLGLAIVRYLVELHGGTVAVESQGQGQGSTFAVTLPCCSAEVAGGLNLQMSTTPSAPLEGIHALVVEDEEDVRLLIRRVLEDGGAKVEAFGSVAEAFDRFEAGTPDVLVADIGMPDYNGYALLARLRTHDRKNGRMTPAIALTAYATPIDRETALAAGFQLHMAKPFQPEELITAVASLVTSGELG